jgi:ammonium transporter, Amt family
MTPGLAFFYGGLVHRKSVLTIMMQCFISLGVVAVLWFLIGFSLAFGETSRNVIGNPASYPLFLNLDICTGMGYPMSAAVPTPDTPQIPGLLFAGYQMMFAIISPALITGAFADRFLFVPYLIFISLWLILVYCPFAHWIWNPQGFFFLWGVRDFAGGIVVHISAGFAALASIIFTGSRDHDSLSEEDRLLINVPHNRTFVALGAGMLWFGWFGFNGGSALGSGGLAVFAAINSSVAAATAMCTWLLTEWLHLGKPSLVGACIGLVAGLATVTPTAGFIRPWAAFLIGNVAGPFCYGCVELRKVFKWDDALDVWGVHGMGGLLGSILLGALADVGIGGMERSGTFFGKQIAACVFCAVWTFVMSYLLLFLINKVTPVLPTKEQMREGLDVSLHGEYAYDDDAVKNAKKALLGELKNHYDDGSVRKLFKDLDSDKNGIIDPEEFKMAMRKLGVKINDDLLTRMHRDADHDKSGGVDEEEFVKLVTKIRNELEGENKYKRDAPAAAVASV